MIKVLFLHPITDSIFGRQSIPITYVSTLIRELGHSCDIFDTTFYDSSILLEDNIQSGSEKLVNLKQFKDWSSEDLEFTKSEKNIFKALQEKIDYFQPDIITFSLWGSHLHAEGEYYAFSNGLKLINNVNVKGAKIFVGGTIPSNNPEEILRNTKVDYIIKGETELVFKDILENFKNFNPDKIDNLNFINTEKRFVSNKLRPLIDPLDQLPDVNFDIYNPKSFKRPFHGKIVNMVDFELSRGCWYRCTFCLSPFQREKTYKKAKNFRREKSIEKIIREISFIKKRYKLDMIRFQDESFNSIKEDKLKELSKEYKKFVDLPFIIEATVNTSTKNRIDYLSEMGCANVGLGIESGSKFIRDKVIDKPKFTNEEAIETIKYYKKKNINVTVYNILGFPQETEDHIIETIKLNHAAKPNHALISYFQPWDGTKLKDIAIKDGYLDPSKSIDQMTLGQQNDSSLKLNIDENKLSYYYDNFVFLVYLNKILWPLIKFKEKIKLGKKIINKFLEFFLKINQKIIKIK